MDKFDIQVELIGGKLVSTMYELDSVGDPSAEKAKKICKQIAQDGFWVKQCNKFYPARNILGVGYTACGKVEFPNNES